MQKVISGFLSKYFIHWLFLLHALWFIAGLLWGNMMYPDSVEYVYQAENMRYHKSFYAGPWFEPHQNYWCTLRPPLYSLMVLICRAIIQNLYFLLLIQSLLSILNFVILLKILKKFVSEKTAVVVLFFGLLLYPFQFIYCNMVMSEILFQTFLIVAFYQLVCFFENGTTSNLFYYNLFLTLSVLVKAVMLYLWLPNLLFMIWLFFKSKPKSALLFGLMMPGVIGLQCKINEYTTGYFHYNSIQTFNRLFHNTKELLIKNEGKAYADSTCKAIWEKGLAKGNLKEHYEFVNAQCKAILTDDVLDYGIFHLKGMFIFMLTPGREDLVYFFRIKESEKVNFMRSVNEKGIEGFTYWLSKINPVMLGVAIVLLIWNVVLTVATALFFWKNRIDWRIKAWLFLLIAYIAFASSLVVGAARFRLPVYPFLLMATTLVIPGKKSDK